MSDGYFVEAVTGERAVALPSVNDELGTELVIEETVSVSEVGGSVSLEFIDGPPQMPFKIGGTDPTADPTVLVWFDTQGA